MSNHILLHSYILDSVSILEFCVSEFETNVFVISFVHILSSCFVIFSNLQEQLIGCLQENHHAASLLKDVFVGTIKDMKVIVGVVSRCGHQVQLSLFR